MFERSRIRREFARIISNLQNSDAFWVHPDILQFFDANLDEAAVVMRRHGWSAFGTCIFLISDVVNYLSDHDSLEKIKIQNSDVHRSLENLYGFAVLATGKRADAEAAFASPQNGRRPFS